MILLHHDRSPIGFYPLRMQSTQNGELISDAVTLSDFPGVSAWLYTTPNVLEKSNMTMSIRVPLSKYLITPTVNGWLFLKLLTSHDSVEGVCRYYPGVARCSCKPCERTRKLQQMQVNAAGL